MSKPLKVAITKEQSRKVYDRFRDEVSIPFVADLIKRSGRVTDYDGRETRADAAELFNMIRYMNAAATTFPHIVIAMADIIKEETGWTEANAADALKEVLSNED